MFDPKPSGANQVAFGMVCHHWEAFLKIKINICCQKFEKFIHTEILILEFNF
jgi:hypothetical protein